MRRRSSWPFKREYRIDQIVPGALVAELDFQAVGEEGQKIEILCRWTVLVN